MNERIKIRLVLHEITLLYEGDPPVTIYKKVVLTVHRVKWCNEKFYEISQVVHFCVVMLSMKVLGYISLRTHLQLVSR